MLNQHNAARRHHIPKISFRVMNWRKYEDGLKQRGGLTLWITPETLEQRNAPRRTTPGGQAALCRPEHGSCLMLRTAFRMPLRQAEGLMESVISPMRLTLNLLDHTTISRRAAKLPPLPKTRCPRANCTC